MGETAFVQVDALLTPAFRSYKQMFKEQITCLTGIFRDESCRHPPLEIQFQGWVSPQPAPENIICKIGLGVTRPQKTISTSGLGHDRPLKRSNPLKNHQFKFQFSNVFSATFLILIPSNFDLSSQFAIECHSDRHRICFINIHINLVI